MFLKMYKSIKNKRSRRIEVIILYLTPWLTIENRNYCTRKPASIQQYIKCIYITLNDKIEFSVWRNYSNPGPNCLKTKIMLLLLLISDNNNCLWAIGYINYRISNYLRSIN